MIGRPPCLPCFLYGHGGGGTLPIMIDGWLVFSGAGRCPHLLPPNCTTAPPFHVPGRCSHLPANCTTARPFMCLADVHICQRQSHLLLLKREITIYWHHPSPLPAPNPCTRVHPFGLLVDQTSSDRVGMDILGLDSKLLFALDHKLIVSRLPKLVFSSLTQTGKHIGAEVRFESLGGENLEALHELGDLSVLPNTE